MPGMLREDSRWDRRMEVVSDLKESCFCALLRTETSGCGRIILAVCQLHANVLTMNLAIITLTI